MENFYVSDVITATGGRLLCGNENTKINNFCTDSNKTGTGNVFVPVLGERVDGHRFIKGALNHGAAASLTASEEAVKELIQEFQNGTEEVRPIILVKDTITALQQTASAYERRLTIPKIGVTGSVGKTTTKEMLACALSAGKKVFKTAGNFNSQIGVPLTLMNISQDDEIAVIEMGMSAEGEMERLAGLLTLNAVVMTNIGVSHIEQLKTQENILKEKWHITDALTETGKVFLNGDDPLLAKKAAEEQASGNDRIITFGHNENCTYHAERVRITGGKLCFEVVYGENSVPVELSVLGNHNVLNGLAAIAAANEFGVDPQAAAAALSTYQGIAMRQQITQKNGITFIDDSYNASPDSMRAGISVLMQTEAKRRIAVLADMLELGESSPEFHRQVGEFAGKSGIDLLLLHGELAKNIAYGAEQYTKKSLHFDTLPQIIDYLKGELRDGDAVLFKGSRGMKLNEVVDYFTGEQTHMAQIIDGKRISKEIKDELAAWTAAYKEKGKDITLAVIQAGKDPASSVYVGNKKKACDYIGIKSLSYELEENVSEEELLKLIDELNKREDVNGILVQLPLPKHINEDKIIQAIDPKKDVDGFHPQNVGALSIGQPGFVSCTPAGIIQLLKRSNIEIAGKECVVIGRSNIVGKPMALLLLRENGTVTIAHSKTKNLKEVARRADILIVAVGKPKFINHEYIKEGAVVIDVGIHRNESNHLCGDVDYEDVLPIAGAVTPVPGGVGPMTIAMLMNNCVQSVRK